VEEQEFRYKGPKPKSKEMGIILLADRWKRRRVL
jgi:membrane-associated HD superfamily phosphohydrolase